MTWAKITHKQATALAAFLVEMRPDWDLPGVIPALGHAKDRGDAQQVAQAAIKAACTQTNRTPAIIGMDGPHWRVSKPERSGPPGPPPFCRRCQSPHNTADCDSDNLARQTAGQQTGATERRAQLIASAKAAAVCRGANQTGDVA